MPFGWRFITFSSLNVFSLYSKALSKILLITYIQCRSNISVKWRQSSAWKILQLEIEMYVPVACSLFNVVQRRGRFVDACDTCLYDYATKRIAVCWKCLVRMPDLRLSNFVFIHFSYLNAGCFEMKLWTAFTACFMLARAIMTANGQTRKLLLFTQHVPSLL